MKRPRIALRRLHYRGAFSRTNEPGTCLYCGAKLRAPTYGKPGDGEGVALGAYMDNAFCTLRCGYRFGVTAAQLKFRLMPRHDPASGRFEGAEGGGA